MSVSSSPPHSTITTLTSQQPLPSQRQQTRTPLLSSTEDRDRSWKYKMWWFHDMNYDGILSEVRIICNDWLMMQWPLLNIEISLLTWQYQQTSWRHDSLVLGLQQPSLSLWSRQYYLFLIKEIKKYINKDRGSLHIIAIENNVLCRPIISPHSTPQIRPWSPSGFCSYRLTGPERQSEVEINVIWYLIWF